MGWTTCRLAPRSASAETVTAKKIDIAAHTQTLTLHIQENVPYHPTRASDPYYHLFNEARARMKRQGLLICWICGTTEHIEVHHTEVEFSMSRGVDITLFAELHPDMGIVDDATFEAYVEGPHNLTALCHLHHTGILGVHSIPGPLWYPQKFWRRDLAVPAEVIA
jgi:hypothetical protein